MGIGAYQVREKRVERGHGAASNNGDEHIAARFAVDELIVSAAEEVYKSVHEYPRAESVESGDCNAAPYCECGGASGILSDSSFLQSLDLRPPQVPVVSNVTGTSTDPSKISDGT